MSKRAPVGVGSFAKLVDPENNYLFVDRTPQLKQLMEEKEVVAFHTFRRGGKSLFASMLHYFLSPVVARVKTAGMFEHLQIGQDKAFVEQHQGQYPVIMLSLKDVQENSFASAQEKMKLNMVSAYSVHDYLLNSPALSAAEKEDVRKMLFDEAISKEKLERSLLRLTELLYQHHNKKVWVIIDEYDTPLTAAYRAGYLEGKPGSQEPGMLGFMKNFLSASLKDNVYLAKGVLTGILRVSKESILSGLNNPKICTLLNPGKYDPYFGFTDAEVVELFNEAGLAHDIDKVRAWYNGYQVDHQRLYNPWSIINCIDNEGKLRPYWVNTANDSLLKKSLLHASEGAKKQFEQLITTGEPIAAEISEHIRFEHLHNDVNALWSLLFSTGYLTAEIIESEEMGFVYNGQLRIPNQEVGYLYQHVFSEWLHQIFEGNHLALLNSLRRSDIAQFTEMLSDYLLSYASIHHLKYEGSYHSLVLGLIYGLSDTHEVFSGTLETGHGYSDLLLIPREKTRNTQAILIEFKNTKTDEAPEAALAQAYTQLENLHYAAALKKYPYIRSVLKVGMTFAGKRVLWKSSEETLNVHNYSIL